MKPKLLISLTKPQIPMTNAQPNPNFQNPKRSNWSLGLGILLGIGIWSLGFNEQWFLLPAPPFSLSLQLLHYKKLLIVLA